ncbi:Protein of unknown function DUF4817 [Trinorchestia longiramus]|nr:Protein of unknown function DUF4817 [Trinorchestia longiramus]
MQLKKEQRIFIVVNFLDSNSIQHVRELFQERIPERNSPSKVIIWKNVRKYKAEGTSLNLNKGRSGCNSRAKLIAIMFPDMHPRTILLTLTTMLKFLEKKFQFEWDFVETDVFCVLFFTTTI